MPHGQVSSGAPEHPRPDPHGAGQARHRPALLPRRHDSRCPGLNRSAPRWRGGRFEFFAKVETVAKNSNLGRIPIEIALVEAAEPPIYLKIGEKARHLRELGTSDKAIARALGVSDKTVAKAIERWGSTAPSTRPA
jgi:hypothetical protein